MYLLDTNVVSELRKIRRDGLIVATALVHGMTVVTRSVADFESTGALILNPWVSTSAA